MLLMLDWRSSSTGSLTVPRFCGGEEDQDSARRKREIFREEDPALTERMRPLRRAGVSAMVVLCQGLQEGGRASYAGILMSGSGDVELYDSTHLEI